MAQTTAPKQDRVVVEMTSKKLSELVEAKSLTIDKDVWIIRALEIDPNSVAGKKYDT